MAASTTSSLWPSGRLESGRLISLGNADCPAADRLTSIGMNNEEKNNTKGGFYGCWVGCWVGSCLGSVAAFFLSMAIMVFFRGKPPFNEIDLVFYLFIGFYLAG
jgi:hypothetical protein